MDSDLGTRRKRDKGRMRGIVLFLGLMLVGCNGDESNNDPEPVTSASTNDDGAEATTSSSDSAEVADTTSEGTASEGDDHAADPLPPDSPETLRAQELFDALLSPMEDWEQTQAELKELGSAAMPVVLAELASSDRARREMAAQELVLLELDCSTETAPLLAALDDESEQVRAYCASVLLTQSPDAAEQAVATLIDVLGGSDPAMSDMAASYLQTFPESVAGQLPQVVAALDDAPPQVAVPLIEALAAAGPQAVDAVETLTELAEGDNPEIAAAARQALEAIQGPAE